MDDFTDDYESDDFSDDFNDDDFTDDEDGDLFEDNEDDLDDDFADDGAVPGEHYDGGDDLDLSLEDATPIGGINLKKAVIFGVAMEWEDEEKAEDARREKRLKGKPLI